jgi:hypothetical protein
MNDKIGLARLLVASDVIRRGRHDVGERVAQCILGLIC